MKGVIRIIFLLVCLASWQGIRADNVVAITGGSGIPGAEVDVSISLSNTDAVSAMQLSIPLADGIDLVENSAQLGSRASATHSATVGVKDGTINVFVFSSSMATISSSTGEIVRFKVKLGKEPTTLTLSSSKLILTDTDGNNVSGTVQNGTISIRTAKAEYSTREIDFGRRPIHGTYSQGLTINNTGNEPLHITALTFSASEFSCTETLPFTIQPGGKKSIAISYAPTERGKVSEELKVTCNSSSKLNTITLNAIPYAVNELHIENASGTSDSEVTIHLRMNNMDAISGFHFEIPIPAQLQYVEGSFSLTDRNKGHQVAVSVVDGTLKALCYSLSDETFSGNDGDIATFKVNIVGKGNTKLSANKAILTAKINGADINVLSDKYDGTITIVTPVMSAASNVNLGNQPVTQPPFYTYTIGNKGKADLTISRITFDNEDFGIKDITLPLTIEASKSQVLTIIYKNASVASHSATMQIYCNDPDKRLYNVNITGSLYSPNFITLSTSNVSPTSTADIAVTLSNHLPISGLQFDVQYPSSNYSLDASSFVFEHQMRDFSANVKMLSKDIARVFLYSLSDKSIAADTAKVMTIKLYPTGEVNAGTYNVNISNLKLGSTDLIDVQSQTTASATFEVHTQKFKLTYMVDGMVYRQYEQEYSSIITPEALPNKEGYSFSGWSAIPETMPKHDVIVEGTFTINSYKLTYMDAGEIINSDDIVYGSTIIPFEAPTKYGYVFLGWYGLPETMPAKDVIVTSNYHVAMAGDVNSDQMVTVNDVNLMVNMLLEGSHKVSEEDPADINKDGNITILDETLLIKKLLDGDTDATIKTGYYLQNIDNTIITDPLSLKVGNKIVIYPYANYSNIASTCMLIADDTNGQLTSWKKLGAVVNDDTDLSPAVWILEDASTYGENCYFIKNINGGYWGYQSRTASVSMLMTNDTEKIPVEIAKDNKYNGLFFIERHTGRGYGLNDLYGTQTRYNWWTTDFSQDSNSSYYIRKIN